MTVGDINDGENAPSDRIRCYFDITLGGLPAGRIVFELYRDIAPKTVENFRGLCTGEYGIGKTTEKPLHYKGVIFHRVVKDFMIQSGDFSAGNGTGGESIYGGCFEDESFNLKHEKSFLLSMANRGKGTNGSQFFITTQPAPHLDNIHVIFGHVVSGHDLVRQLEQLPVDRNFRPLQDAVISKCGELVRQIKVKKEKKAKKPRSDTGSDSTDDDDKRKVKKEKKKKKKKSKENEKEPSEDRQNPDHEEGEIDEGEVHPMVTVTKIDPKDIPEVSNKFLMRVKRESVNEDSGGGGGGGGGGVGTVTDKSDREDKKHIDRRREREKEGRDTRNFGWSKRRVPLSRSGRLIKGRGVFRYRTPSRSRSRTRSVTPPHWRQAQKRTIKLADLEKSEEEKRQREIEIKRREAERKKRHEEMARDTKKSFFELNQEHNYKKPKAVDSEKEEGELDTTVEISINQSKIENEEKRSPVEEKIGCVDMNALDYEDVGSDREETDESNNKKKSESMALAFGVKVKPNDYRQSTSNFIQKDPGTKSDVSKKEDKKSSNRSSESYRRLEPKNQRRISPKYTKNRNLKERKNFRSPRILNYNVRSIGFDRRNRSKSSDRGQRSKSGDRWQYSRSNDRRQRSRSIDRRQRSKSNDRKRSKSPIPGKDSKSTDRAKRSKSPNRHQGSKSSNRREHSKSAERRRFSKSLGRNQRTKSRDERNRSKSPNERQRSRSLNRHQRSKSIERYRSSKSFNRNRSKSDDRRQQSKSVDRRQRSKSLGRSRRNRSTDGQRSKDRKRRSRSTRRQRSRNSRSRSRSHSKQTRDLTRHEASPSDSKAAEQSTLPPTEEDKDRINKEKMMKRAEAILMLKDHMRKEIEEQGKRQAEKQKAKEALERAEAEMELARLEKIKKETLEKLQAQEEIKKLVAVKKVLEAVVSSVSNTSKKSRRASSSSSDNQKEKKRKRTKKRSRRYSSSD